VKAIDELCTRTFAVHTLKSPPTKIPNSPTGGGGALAPLRPPVAPPLIMVRFSVWLGSGYAHVFVLLSVVTVILSSNEH